MNVAFLAIASVWIGGERLRRAQALGERSEAVGHVGRRSALFPPPLRLSPLRPKSGLDGVCARLRPRAIAQSLDSPHRARARSRSVLGAAHKVHSLVYRAIALLFLVATARAELPEIRDTSPDLSIPATINATPAAGLRVRQTTSGWEGTEVHHTLYLPVNWTPTGRWPVLVEYAGNGDFQDRFGDVCDGSVEGCSMGYGLSAGRDFIWLCLPFVEVSDGRKRNAKKWWGDPDESARYAVATVRDVCARFGGDPRRVVLSGFSRGSIGCNFIGLRNDEIAALWCGMLCHSHYDGVRSWPYAESDRESAKVRLLRLKDRPQFISQEGDIGTRDTEEYLRTAGVPGRFTFVPFPYRDHTDIWALRDCDFRRKARAWLAQTVRGRYAESEPK